MRIRFLLAVVCALLVIAGCTSDDAPQTAATSSSTTAAPTTVPTTTARQPSTTFPPGAYKMPDFTNWNLQAVIDTLWNEAGYDVNNIGFITPSGERPPLRWVDWLVVWQSPEPGSPVTADTRIVLQISRS
jgi:hypothetical protein